jgi:hypothetical protein
MPESPNVIAKVPNSFLWLWMFTANNKFWLAIYFYPHCSSKTKKNSDEIKLIKIIIILYR